LVLNAGTLTFTATRTFTNLRNLSQETCPHESKSEGFYSFSVSQLSNFLLIEYLKSLGNLEAIINLQDVFECKAMTFAVPTAKTNPNPTNNNAHILQLMLHNHGDQYRLDPLSVL